MGWRLRLWRRAKVLPGVMLNLSKSGFSISLGPRGSKVTLGRRGIRRTVGLPGTGIYATDFESWRHRQEGRSPGADAGERTPAAGATSDSRGSDGAANPEEAPTRCGFCGGRCRSDGRCSMCGQVCG